MITIWSIILVILSGQIKENKTVWSFAGLCSTVTAIVALSSPCGYHRAYVTWFAGDLFRNLMIADYSAASIKLTMASPGVYLSRCLSHNGNKKGCSKRLNAVQWGVENLLFIFSIHFQMHFLDWSMLFWFHFNKHMVLMFFAKLPPVGWLEVRFNSYNIWCFHQISPRLADANL